jgi:hypothetical protein
MLKQMSEKGADAKKGWSSSRSSSGEGPDEVVSIDGHQADNEPLSPSYNAPQTTTTETNNSTGFNDHQLYTTEQKQESSSLVDTDKADAPQSDASLGQEHQPYQSNELESSESRKLVAEADDLKSKLRELNIGSFSLDGQDG